MVCPNCGCEIAEGHLYCETCGTEIQIVPDFEPEIENSIIETLSTVGEEIEESGADGTVENKAQTDETQEKNRQSENQEQAEESFFKDIPKQGIFPVLLISAVLIALIAALGAGLLYRRNSVSYQVGRARKLVEEGRYEEAAGFMDRARELSPEDTEIALLEVEYLNQTGESDRALEILLELVDRTHLEYEEKERVFEYIIELYTEKEEYGKINALLTACGDLDIQNHFQQYMAMTPEFGYESGTYEEVIHLRISANTAGKIYYTTDGSIPDEHSMVYTAPLLLETGEFQICAIFVNDYGIKSEIARSWYIINLTVPDAPEVLPVSGDYHLPVAIEAEKTENGEVYYTTDGSEPTIDSARYTEPIPMPLGRTNFKFIEVSEEGVSSEVTSRSYDLELETDVTVNMAVHNVMQALLDRRVLNDMQGHSHEIEGKYVFVPRNTIVEIEGLGYYYVLDEYEESVNGNRTKTERLYAVEVYTGAPNRLTYDANGKMGLISLGD